MGITQEEPKEKPGNRNTATVGLLEGEGLGKEGDCFDKSIFVLHSNTSPCPQGLLV